MAVPQPKLVARPLEVIQLSKSRSAAETDEPASQVPTSPSCTAKSWCTAFMVPLTVSWL